MAGQRVKRGERNFIVRIYLGRDGNGKRDYHNQTVRGSKKGAQAVLNKLLRDKDMGVLLTPERITFDAHLDEWLENVVKTGVRERTHRDYVNISKRYLRGPLGSRLLTQITPPEVRKVYSAMLARGLAPRTVRYCHTVLHMALSQAVKWRRISQNPADHADLPRKERREMQALSKEQAAHFLEVSRADPYHALFALLLTTGLRPSEALALKWTDLDTTTGTLSVQRTLARPRGEPWCFEEPKTARSRRSFEIPAGTVRLLLEHRVTLDAGEHNLMFPNENAEPIHLQNLTKRNFKRVRALAGLPDTFRLYDLRHTCATLLLLANVHPKIVADRLGHSSISETMNTYSHVLPGMQ